MPVARSQGETAGAAIGANLAESSLLTLIPSGFNVGVFSRIKGCVGGLTDAHYRFAAAMCALHQDVTRHARSCQKQGPERDEKCNHQPAHRSKLGQEYQTGRSAQRRSGLAKAGLQPFEVGVAGSFNAENQELRGLVTVQLVQASFKGGQLIGAGLEKKQGFRGGLDLALPVINGLDGWDQGGAGCEALLDEGAGEAVGLVRGGGGG